MSAPLPGRALTVLGAERPDPDGTGQYRFLAARGTLRMASAIQRM
jgi:hypothetical protein